MPGHYFNFILAKLTTHVDLLQSWWNDAAGYQAMVFCIPAPPQQRKFSVAKFSCNDESLMFPKKILRKIFPENFRIFFEFFKKLFVRFVLSKIFLEIGRAETIRLVHKSSNFELSSRFFGRLKTETKVLRKHYY